MTLNWPPNPSVHGDSHDIPDPDSCPVTSDMPLLAGTISEPLQILPDLPNLSLAAQVHIGLADPRLIRRVADITAMVAARLDDGASAAKVMPEIKETARRWLEQQVRSGLLPASAGGAIDELAKAVHDQRYGLGPVTPYLRDPRVENVDINGCDQDVRN